MKGIENLPKEFQELYNEGKHIKEAILNLLDKWPTTSTDRRVSATLGNPYKQEVEDLLNDLRLWFNTLGIRVSPHSVLTRMLLLAF